MNANSVCPMNCPNRSPTCHAECETYLAAREENLKRYEQTKKDFQINVVIDRGIAMRLRKLKRKKKAR